MIAQSLNEPLFHIETWRGRWFYKFGSRYTGPFQRRDEAIDAAHRDLSTLKPCHTAPLRASLSETPWYSELR